MGALMLAAISLRVEMKLASISLAISLGAHYPHKAAGTKYGSSVKEDERFLCQLLSLALWMHQPLQAQ